MSEIVHKDGSMSPPDGLGPEIPPRDLERGSRRRCPSCRYDRSGLPTRARCPECGAPPPNPGRMDAGELASSRAMIALGMSVLAWIGLVGFGIPATILGFGACYLAGRAARVQHEQADPEPGVRAIILSSYALGGGAAVTGIIVFVALAVVL